MRRALRHVLPRHIGGWVWWSSRCPIWRGWRAHVVLPLYRWAYRCAWRLPTSTH